MHDGLWIIRMLNGSCTVATHAVKLSTSERILRRHFWIWWVVFSVSPTFLSGLSIVMIKKGHESV